MLLRIGFICATLLSAVFSLSADEKVRTHPARPAELLAVIAQADKLVVFDSTPAVYAGDGNAPAEILYSSVNHRDISELRESIVIETPKDWFRCACIPPVGIMLSQRGKELGVISLYEDLTISFSRWSGDARIADQEKLLKWFDIRGMAGPRRAVERELAREKTYRAASERWLTAMPPNLRPLWPKLMKDSQWWSNSTVAVVTSANALKPELATEYPDFNQRIRSLFAWFGSGAGPWSGYPAYEDVPSHLLLEYQPSELLSAVQETALTESESEGVARFFAGYTPGHLFRPAGDNTLINLLPDELKKSLLERALKSGDQDNVERARRAFEQH